MLFAVTAVINNVTYTASTSSHIALSVTVKEAFNSGLLKKYGTELDMEVHYEVKKKNRKIYFASKANFF
jgi:hypothetical protein